MKNRYIIGVFAFLLGFITCLAIIRPKASLTIADIAQSSGMPDKIIKMMGLEWTKKAKICDLGNYKIAVPTDGKTNAYFLWTEKGPVILSQDMNLTLFDQQPRNESSKIILSLQDRGNKGFYSRLDYRILDANGKPAGNVTDINMDGQPDFKYFDYDKENKKGQVWINNEWYELNRQDDKPGIFKNGKFTPVESTDNGWQIKK